MPEFCRAHHKRDEFRQHHWISGQCFADILMFGCSLSFGFRFSRSETDFTCQDFCFVDLVEGIADFRRRKTSRLIHCQGILRRFSCLQCCNSQHALAAAYCFGSDFLAKSALRNGASGQIFRSANYTFEGRDSSAMAVVYVGIGDRKGLELFIDNTRGRLCPNNNAPHVSNRVRLSSDLHTMCIAQ